MQKQENKLEIVHIINSDKFTSGYINFMQTQITECSHFFICLKSEYKLNDIVESNIYIINSYFEIIQNSIIKNKLLNCKKIIVSGVFGVECYMLLCSKKIWNKTYLHFWGGDFYQYETFRTVSKYIHKLLFKICVNRANALIFLIDKEYERFLRIIHIEKKHYVAPMPGDPLKRIQYQEYRNRKKGLNVRVLIGNSATDSNRHEEIFIKLLPYRFENIEIYCPLSYGDEKYRRNIIELGNDLWGEKFHPVLNFMEQEEYLRFLSTCDIGIFNCDRQQAMGNITMLLGLGKKVYIRQGTSMWDRYVDEGNIVYPVEMIDSNSFYEFSHFNEQASCMNELIADKRDSIKNAYECWSRILKCEA